ncbi:hypothetical protein QTP88_021551 [Uroleucon formosanum]
MSSSEDADDILLACACAITTKLLVKKKQRKRRRWWMRSLYRNKNLYSGSMLLNDLKNEDGDHFKNCSFSLIVPPSERASPNANKSFGAHSLVFGKLFTLLCSVEFVDVGAFTLGRERERTQANATERTNVNGGAERERMHSFAFGSVRPKSGTIKETLR